KHVRYSCTCSSVSRQGQRVRSNPNLRISYGIEPRGTTHPAFPLMRLELHGFGGLLYRLEGLLELGLFNGVEIQFQHLFHSARADLLLWQELREGHAPYRRVADDRHHVVPVAAEHQRIDVTD